eukprot:430447_1
MHDNQKQISLIPLIQLFPHLKEITLNELNIHEMETNSRHYVKVVKKYIDLCKANEKLEQLTKVSFKSKTQPNRKENSTLKSLMLAYASIMREYHWSIQYDNQEDTHNLIFVNENTTTKTKIRRHIGLKPQPTMLDIYTSKQTQIPSYFMQITSVNVDDFQIKLILDKACDKRRKFFIKQIEGRDHEIIVIRKGQISATRDIQIDEKQNKYHLALYDSKNAYKSLPNSNKIKLNLIKDKKTFPPQNPNYMPKCVDLSTVLQATDHKTKKMNIYWAIPSESFGEISYKIIKDETKEQEIISLLPYSISLSLLPLSFKVITINMVDNNSYESDASEIITVEYTAVTNDSVT